MSNGSVIAEALAAEGITLANAIVSDEQPDSNSFVFVEVVRNSDNHQIPSNMKLREIQKVLLLRDIRIEFVLIDGTTRDIEIGARASLLHAFGKKIRNVFLTVEHRQASLWLVLKQKLSDEDLAAINLRLSLYLNSFELNLVATKITAFENLPTKTAILKRIRLKAPVALDALVNHFNEQNFVVPSGHWFSHQLDSLRKDGAIVRLKSGNYAMSLRSLQTLGTSKNRRSPDIARLLDLARRS